MSEAVVTILALARDRREKAAQAKRLAAGAGYDDIAVRLIRYAEELEQSARELEERALVLAETVTKTEMLSADIRSLVNEVGERLKALRSKSSTRRQ